MVEILLQLVELEILGDAVHARGLGDWLEGAEHDLAGRPPCNRRIRRGRAGRAAWSGLGDDVEMIAGLQWHVDAGPAADLARPHAGAVDDVLAGDVACGAGPAAPADAGDAAALAPDPGDAHALDGPSAVLPRAVGQRQRDVGRVALAVLRQPEPPVTPSMFRCS